MKSIARLYDCIENVKVKPEVRQGYMMLEEYIYYERKEAAEEAAAEATVKTRAEIIVSTTRENIIELLEDLGEISQDILDRIEKEEDAAG